AEVIWRSLLEGTLHSRLWELLERSLRDGAAETAEIRFPGAAGRILRVHAAPILGEGERLAGGVLVLQDLTEARRLEEMRRQFVANVSHELKSPVAGLRAWADAGAVEQTLANLVDNAIRYSPPGARVALDAAARGEEILFTVTDTGPGIPPEALPRVFERFYRVDSGRARADGGTGLGLAIARHLVEAQGGRIWLENPPGGGSRF